jgi:hypothetical protein
MIELTEYTLASMMALLPHIASTKAFLECFCIAYLRRFYSISAADLNGSTLVWDENKTLLENVIEMMMIATLENGMTMIVNLWDDPFKLLALMLVTSNAVCVTDMWTEEQRAAALAAVHKLKPQIRRLRRLGLVAKVTNFSYAQDIHTFTVYIRE